MEKVKIFRVEDEDHFGPYQWNIDMSFYEKHNNNKRTHPTLAYDDELLTELAYDDELLTELAYFGKTSAEEYHYGFDSIDKLKSWFDEDDLKELEEKEFYVSIYEVPANKTLHSKYQSLFKLKEENTLLGDIYLEPIKRLSCDELISV